MVRTLIDTTAGLVIHEAEGPLSLGEIEDELRATLANPAYRPGMKTVWDLRGASIASLTDDAVRSLIEFNLVRKERRGGGRAAIVTAQDDDHRVAQMFQIYAEALPWETMVFRRLDDALPWLNGSSERRAVDVMLSDDSGAESPFGRAFIDPDRGLEWRASIGLDVDGRFCPVFRLGGVRLWGDEEITVDVDLVSEVLLRDCWWGSRREVWYNGERWWVRWEGQESEETWTWFESDSGAARVIKAQYPFPYSSDSDLAGALDTAVWIE